MSNYRLTITEDGLLRYRYDCGPDVGFDFNTLAEVGQPYQQWFRDEIKSRNLTVQYGCDLDRPPWVADVVRAGGATVEPDGWQ